MQVYVNAAIYGLFIVWSLWVNKRPYKFISLSIFFLEEKLPLGPGLRVFSLVRHTIQLWFFYRWQRMLDLFCWFFFFCEKRCVLCCFRKKVRQEEELIFSSRKRILSVNLGDWYWWLANLEPRDLLWPVCLSVFS